MKLNKDIVPNIVWHNPDGLTDEQVGVKDGWRLALPEEPLPDKYMVARKADYSLALYVGDILDTEEKIRSVEVGMVLVNDTVTANQQPITVTRKDDNGLCLSWPAWSSGKLFTNAEILGKANRLRITAMPAREYRECMQKLAEFLEEP